jgi:peptidoglycan/LPS O-acetylase OafA/YrhL
MRYDVLDGLRGVAALAVVTAHTGPYFGPLTFGDSGLAVDLFFCLSGFVITAAYAERLPAMGIRRFMALRYIRLYPLYVVGTALGVVAYCLRPDPAVSLGKALLWSLLLLPTPAVLTAPLLPLNVPGWSLVSELAVNLLWAVLGFKLTTRRVAVFTVGSAMVMAMGALLSRGHTIALGFQLDQLPFGMARAVLSFTIGIMLFRRLQQRPAMRKGGALPALMLGIVALLFVPALGGVPRFVYDMAVITIAFPCVVYVAAQLRPGDRMTRLCAFLGAISYGVYAIHDPLSNVIDGCGFDAARYAPWSGIALVVLLAILVAVLDRYYDVPLRRRLLGLFAEERAMPATALPDRNPG